jgi:thymidylate kinase
MNRNYSLQVIEQLVHNLNAAGIRYCHWKGNEHLSTTLTGQGDLDLLFHREDSARVSAVFADLGFKHYPAPAWKYNSGVQDFVGFDETSGKIVHFHTYFRLVMGDRQLQEYRLPWEDDILASAAPAEEDIPMPVPGPEAEMLVLIARSSLKMRFRDRFLRAAFRKTLSKDYERNRVWLSERIDEAKLKKLSDKWLHPDLWPRVRDTVFSPVSASGFLKLGKKVAAHLAKFRTYGPVESFVRARLREAIWVFGAINKRYLHWATPWGRTAGNGGAIICILGADGSGKSSLTSEIIPFLNYKLCAIPIYMGSGDGRSSILRIPLVLMRKAMSIRFPRRKADRGQQAKSDPRPKTQRSFPLRVGLLVWGVVLALEKRGKLFKARRAANLGMIVITDRYPQAQIFGFNDGPLLQDFATSRFSWIRAVSSWELGVYRLAEQIRPDLVIKLAVSPDTAISRKPEMHYDEIVRRNDAVAAFSFAAETRVVTISSELPQAEVIRLAKKVIWAVV